MASPVTSAKRNKSMPIEKLIRRFLPEGERRLKNGNGSNPRYTGMRPAIKPNPIE
jgi:hypothetical protein